MLKRNEKGRWLCCLYCSSKWRTRLAKGYPHRCPRCEAVVSPCQMVMDVDVMGVDAQRQRTIKFSELKRLSICNSARLPSPVNVLGRRMRWVGIGWVDEGPADGSEQAVVVDG